MSGSIWITLGHKAEGGIDEHGQLVIRKVENGQVTSSILLGPATEERLDLVLLHLSSLRIHTKRR